MRKITSELQSGHLFTCISAWVSRVMPLKSIHSTFTHQRTPFDINYPYSFKDLFLRVQGKMLRRLSNDTTGIMFFLKWHGFFLKSLLLSSQRSSSHQQAKLVMNN